MRSRTTLDDVAIATSISYVQSVFVHLRPGGRTGGDTEPWVTFRHRNESAYDCV